MAYRLFFSNPPSSAPHGVADVDIERTREHRGETRQVATDVGHANAAHDNASCNAAGQTDDVLDSGGREEHIS
jgi:hypothetical protein